jgi:hypothetical protein
MHRSFIAMRGPRSLAVHSGSFFTVSRAPAQPQETRKSKRKGRFERAFCWFQGSKAPLSGKFQATCALRAQPFAQPFRKTG